MQRIETMRASCPARFVQAPQAGRYFGTCYNDPVDYTETGSWVGGWSWGDKIRWGNFFLFILETIRHDKAAPSNTTTSSVLLRQKILDLLMYAFERI